MNSNETIEAVISYIRDENARYAILIDGVWGSGKTYLYENYLANAVESIESGKGKRKSNVYISLYGISNIDALAKQLITNYLIYVKGNGRKLFKNGLKPLAGIIGVASSAFSFSIGSISADFAGVLKKIASNIAVKDMVICFDDLERCTIPINEFFGLVNNLVEHCNCKVIILADEKNIGKIYANTNLEKKYLTVLTGNRKVVKYTGDEKNTRAKKDGIGKEKDEEITVEEVKNLNEILYSENYIYKDIKEKVIGKTIVYSPLLKEVILEVIKGNEKSKGIIQDGKYKEYLLEHMNEIVWAFNETENRNLRIIKMWIYTFKKIYDTTEKYYSDNKYYEDILKEFLRYSVVVAGALKKNEKIMHGTNYGNQDCVFFKGHEYVHILRYSFIDAWICRDAWDDADLLRACNSIMERKETENVDNKTKIRSTGVELSELKDWFLMDDEQVENILIRLEKEVAENQYAYYDYSNIITTLLFLQEKGLYTGNIESVKNTMIDLIKKDGDIQEENDFPKNFASEEMRNKYNGLYNPIAEERKIRNREISKSNQEEVDIYKNADIFYQYCCKMEQYYCRHKSFLEYLNFDKLNALINASDNGGIYTICRTFKAIYFMDNLREFYVADIEGLKIIRKNIGDENIVKQGGITRKLALDSFSDLIKSKLILLGVDEHQMG